jgi:hypothetical protein
MHAWCRSLVFVTIAASLYAGCTVGTRDNGAGDGTTGADATTHDGGTSMDASGDTARLDGSDASTPTIDTNSDAPPQDGGGSHVVMPPPGVITTDGGWIYPDGGAWYPPCPMLGDGGNGCGPAEVCGNGVDDNCNGLADEGCPCAPGAMERCYDGCPSQAGIGVCTWGVQTCSIGAEFGMYMGRCSNEGHPQPIVCGGERDYLCDGMIDEGCSCSAGDLRACYTGPASTRGVGECHDGTQSCVAMDGGTGWGPCTNEMLPAAPTCGTDTACDGMPFEGCACTPGATRSCYDGPSGTEGIGICHAGTQTCDLNGTTAAWGPCLGEVLPSADMCDGIDRLCNGSPDMGCGCPSGTMRACYSGPSGTEGVGLCHAGTQTCMAGTTGGVWGACIGQVTPSCDICDGLDHECNGVADTGCACMPGSSIDCYDGPASTLGVGACHGGTQTCSSGAAGCGSSYGSCSGEVLPGAIVCDGVDHACDGNYAADCPCMLGNSRSCYDGPAGTAGVGTCAPGTQQCVVSAGGGTTWGACSGEVVPAAAQCDGLDHACSGVLPNCNPTVRCPAPVTTSVGAAGTVTLTGSAIAVAPATITSYAWSVISQPAGSTFSFSTTTANPTRFTANNAGVYTIRLTVTDSLGRQSSCSSLVTVTARSYLGTEFWAVTTTNAELLAGSTFQFAVAIGNPNSTAVTATISGGALAAPMTVTVPANNTVTQTLPWVTALSQNQAAAGMGHNPGGFIPSVSALVTAGAYHIVTTAPVSMYQFNPLTFTTGGGRPTYSYTNDASLLLPTVAWTSNYIAMAHNSFNYGGSFVAIVATSNATTVTVQLTAPITAGTGVNAVPAGSTVTYNLNAGDVVQLIAQYGNPIGCSRVAATCGMGSNPPCCSTTQCAFEPACGSGALPPCCTYESTDLTGTIITSNNPVGVFGGEDCASISNTGSAPACDHLEQMMFPVETWGRDVIVSQFQDRGITTEPYYVRIMSAQNGNTITFNPAATHMSVTLNAGQVLEFCNQGDFEVTSALPILVGQFMVGQNVTSCSLSCTGPQATPTACMAHTTMGTCTADTANFCTWSDYNYAPPIDGDPSFTLEVPTTQYRHDYNFVVPTSYTASFINVVYATGATINLDGVTLPAGTAIAGTSWSVLRHSIAAGSHQINTAGAAGFGLKVSGVATYTSYGYPGGLDLSLLP